MKLTDRAIQAIKPAEKRYEVWETNGKGFGLRVSPAGRKTWIFMYRFQGKSRRMTFGDYPDMPLADAHEEHARARKLLNRGIDPGNRKQAAIEVERRAPTVADLVKEFLKSLEVKGNRTWREYERSLNKDVVPEWGHVKAKDIRRRDVVLLMEKIAGRGAVNQSTQVFKIVRRMFNFAVERDLLEHSPCLQVKPLAPDNKKDRFLSEEEIKTFWTALEKCGMTEELKRALKLILVTAQRPGEVIGAHESEMDGEWWTIPAERSKNKRSHRVFLTPLAQGLFLEPDEDGFYFPSPRGGRAIEVNALAHAVRRAMNPDKETGEVKLALDHFTPHDLRRTAASHMAQLGYGVIVEKVLNHTNRTVTAIYDRYDYDREKRQALEGWARKLERILSDKKNDNVIEFRKG